VAGVQKLVARLEPAHGWDRATPVALIAQLSLWTLVTVPLGICLFDLGNVVLGKWNMRQATRSPRVS
jgi:hypothetical protein